MYVKPLERLLIGPFPTCCFKTGPCLTPPRLALQIRCQPHPPSLTLGLLWSLASTCPPPPQPGEAFLQALGYVIPKSHALSQCCFWGFKVGRERNRLLVG